MALILSFVGARKTRVGVNYYSYFFLSFADLLCLGGWAQLCKRPNSALIGWEKKKPRRVQSEIAMFNQRLKQDRTWQQISTAAQDSGAHVLYDFSRITAPSPIFLFTDKIRKPFPIEWCKELPPHHRSFGYRGLSNSWDLYHVVGLWSCLNCLCRGLSFRFFFLYREKKERMDDFSLLFESATNKRVGRIKYLLKYWPC